MIFCKVLNAILIKTYIQILIIKIYTKKVQIDKAGFLIVIKLLEDLIVLLNNIINLFRMKMLYDLKIWIKYYLKLPFKNIILVLKISLLIYNELLLQIIKFKDLSLIQKL